MAFRYVVKKRMVGIGTKTEKYVSCFLFRSKY